LDTKLWEEHLAQLLSIEISHLLSWAAEVAEADMILETPITYLETSLTPITTTHISFHAREYLKSLSMAEINSATGGWSWFTPEWWGEHGNQALGALKALRFVVADGQSAD